MDRAGEEMRSVFVTSIDSICEMKLLSSHSLLDETSRASKRNAVPGFYMIENAFEVAKRSDHEKGLEIVIEASTRSATVEHDASATSRSWRDAATPFSECRRASVIS
jgi:hypothetical protein